MSTDVKIEKGHRTRWEQLHNEKTSILAYAEQYAQWTLPYVFPRDNTNQQESNIELPIAQDSIGAKGVNHLSNRIISTLFPAKHLFFRLVIDQEVRDLVEQALMASGVEGDELKQQLETQIQAAEAELLKAEKRAEERLNMVRFRPEAVTVAKLLIVTGNALVFFPPDKRPVQVFNFRNYHVVRDVSGEVIEIMTRETKAFATFNNEVQDALRKNSKWRSMHKEVGNSKDYGEETPVTIYTRIVLEDDGKFHVSQYADDVRLPTDVVYTQKDLRWVPLVWNLMQGDNYGRGLVADFAGAFHAINTLSTSLLNIAAVMGDIKIFVDPQSMIDVEHVQDSASGTYHAGRPEQVGTMKLDKITEAQFLQAMIERYERQIAAAFMLTSELTRNAERVTAHEIQRDVDELEASNSGIYSQLASGWQYRMAILALNDSDFDGIGDGVEPKVITGMDSLSRAGEAYNMRLFLTDLSMLNTVPEDIRKGIKVPAFISQIGAYHQVPYESFVATQAELDALAQADTARAQQLEQTKQAGAVQGIAAKAAVEQGA
jgi:hypothetical protein